MVSNNSVHKVSNFSQFHTRYSCGWPFEPKSKVGKEYCSGRDGCIYIYMIHLSKIQIFHNMPDQEPINFQFCNKIESVDIQESSIPFLWINKKWPPSSASTPQHSQSLLLTSKEWVWTNFWSQLLIIHRWFHWFQIFHVNLNKIIYMMIMHPPKNYWCEWWWLFALKQRKQDEHDLSMVNGGVHRVGSLSVGMNVLVIFWGRLKNSI